MVMPPPVVALVTLASTPVPQVVELTAQVEGTREVEVRARVTGILLAQSYQEGASVKAGDLLFKIDPAPYEVALALAKAQLGQEKARVEQASAEAGRQAALIKVNAASTKDAADAQSTFAAATAAVEVAAAKVRAAELDLSYCEVRAPIAGFTGRLNRSEGSLVSPGVDGLLTTVVQREQVWVRFGLSEQQYARLFLGNGEAAAKAKVEVVLPSGDVYPTAGKVNFVAAQVESRLGTVQMRAEFANPQAVLLPGQYVRVRVVGRTLPDVFVIPAASLMQSAQGRFVWLANDKNEAVMAPVVVDEISGPIAVILSGLKTGDRLVTDNLQKVRPGAPVLPRPAAVLAPSAK
jgi:membrane fusion protein (multidrug efflux system)